ncbi:MucBP domain-containing protein [Fructilactobacillus sp. Tb1]|uniref:MucBP domain-containing protein n=1 Tax=Fructilactobacillus sp. Tb1 TaxID=3422304 RepID=UPI003D29EE03
MFNFFKNLFALKPPIKNRPKHRKPAKAIEIPIENDDISEPVQVISTNTELAVKAPATVLVRFLNDQDQELEANLIFKSYIGSPLKLTIPSIEGYIFKKIDGISSEVIAAQQTIIIHYQKELGQPIMIYCFDYDNNQLLQVPTFLSGVLGTTYHVDLPTIKGYLPHLAIGELSGQYGNDPQNIVLYYRREDWKTVQPVNYLISIKTPATVYKHPTEQESYPFTLPIGSVWKIFKEVRTNNQVWLSLGGAEWIKQDYTSRITDKQKQLK